MTGESDELFKMPMIDPTFSTTPDSHGKQKKGEVISTPFLISGTKVVDGSGLMLVLTGKPSLIL